MKRGKFLCVLTVIVLLLSLLCSCQSEEKKEEFYHSRSARAPLTDVLRISLGEYRFVSFLKRGLIEVASGEGDDERFGVMDGAGRIVIPAEYGSFSMTGDFLLATGDSSGYLYNVFNKEGKLVYHTNKYIDIDDVGGGCVRILEEGDALLYDDEGKNLLAATSLDKSFDYSVCEDYVIAKNSRTVLLLDARTGAILRTFSSASSAVTYDDVAYVGKGELILLRNERVSSEKDCTVVKDGNYLKQTILKYSIGKASTRTLSLDRHIVSIGTPYSFGNTQEDRENYPLASGCFAVAYYETENKVAVGTSHYIGDANLSVVKTLPESANPLLSMIDNVAALCAPSGKIYLVNDKTEVLATIDDAVYQDVRFSGSVLTASKVVDGIRRSGGFDLDGRQVIPFEYTYISEFIGGKAIAVKQEKVYLIDAAGTERYLSEARILYYWVGFYETSADGKIGLASFDGEELLPTSFDGVRAVSFYGDEVFIALSKGESDEIYRLF